MGRRERWGRRRRGADHPPPPGQKVTPLLRVTHPPGTPSDPLGNPLAWCKFFTMKFAPVIPSKLHSVSSRTRGGTPHALHEGGGRLLVEIWRSCCAPPVEPPSPQTHRDGRGVATLTRLPGTARRCPRVCRPLAPKSPVAVPGATVDVAPVGGSGARPARAVRDFLLHLRARRARSVERLIRRLARSPRPAPVDRSLERPAEHKND
jgi:hypothetical protein